MKSSFFNYNLYNPISRSNNCFFVCLAYITKTDVDSRKLRKEFGIETGAKVTVAKAYEIIRHLNHDVLIIDSETNEELNDKQKYLILKNLHYYMVESFESIIKKDKRTRRGNLVFDLETRPTEEYHLIKASNTKSYILKDTLCRVYYNSYTNNSNRLINSDKCYITNNEKSSIRQFVDWLNEESKMNRSYNVIAHNGGNFDFYLFISCLTEKELLDCDMKLRRTTIIDINYRGNLLKDSYCF